MGEAGVNDDLADGIMMRRRDHFPVHAPGHAQRRPIAAARGGASADPALRALGLADIMLGSPAHRGGPMWRRRKIAGLPARGGDWLEADAGRA